MNFSIDSNLSYVKILRVYKEIYNILFINANSKLILKQMISLYL